MFRKITSILLAVCMVLSLALHIVFDDSARLLQEYIASGEPESRTSEQPLFDFVNDFVMEENGSDTPELLDLKNIPIIPEWQNTFDFPEYGEPLDLQEPSSPQNSQGPPPPPRTPGSTGGSSPDETPDFVPGEVLTLADSQEHAESIAAAYDLELMSYAYGVAVFLTSDPEQEVARSEEMSIDGIPSLSLNLIYELFEIFVEDDLPGDVDDEFDEDDTEFDESDESDETEESDEPDESGELGEEDINGEEIDSELLSAYQWFRAEMDIDLAHTLGGATGAGVIVAVVDTGIDTTHTAFTGRISTASHNSHTQNTGLTHVRDDNPSSHGTHVSGIVGGAKHPTQDAIGAAPAVTIMAIKANDPANSTVFQMASVIRGINYAVTNGAHIINLSLGRSFASGPYEPERTAIVNAVNRGVLVIAAAGNERDSNAGYPAAYPEVLAVSATQSSYRFASGFSNHGPQIEISAPGDYIYSTINGGNRYGYMTGTSMAAPNVAGVAALIKGNNPSLSMQQVRERLLTTARDAGDVGRDNYFGHGIVNAYAAILGTSGLRTVTFDFADGIRSPVVIRVIPGGTLLPLNDPTRHRHTFNGWFISGSGVRFSPHTTITSNITLYAGWTSFTAVPEAPINFLATAGNGSVRLSWSAPFDDGGLPILYYQVSQNNGASWVNASGSNSHTFAGLSNGVSYTFRVRAVNSMGSGTQASTTAVPDDELNQFIRRLYINILGRNAESDGLSFWRGAVLNGSYNGSTLSEWFFFSPEYLGRNRTDEQFIDDLYITCMGRQADTGGRNYWLNWLRQSVSRRQLMNTFLQSPEFMNICAQFGVPAGSLTMTEPADMNTGMTMFVHRNYEVFLDRRPDRSGLNHWTGTMLFHGFTGSRVAENFVFSNEFRNRNMTDEQFVRYMYNGMMGRQPDQSGLNFWMGQMSRFSTQEQGRRFVFQGFASSPEFAAICAGFGVRAT